MKKIFWIVALLAALAMVTTGCDTSSPGGGDPPPPKEWETSTIFTLSEYLQELVDDDVLTINTEVDLGNSANTDLLKDLWITNAGDIKFKVVEIDVEVEVDDGNGGTTTETEKALALEIEVPNDTHWGAGLDLLHSKFNFQSNNTAKDTISVKGRILETFQANTSAPSYATPLLYMTTNIKEGTDRPELLPEKDLVKDTPYEKTINLTATNVSTIKASSPQAVRIGGRPGGVKFSIDEIVVSRSIVKGSEVPAATKYTVTFLDADKTITSPLGTVQVEDGLTVGSIASLDWYTTYKATVTTSGKEITGWKNLAGDTDWNLTTTTVTANVSLYAVLAAAEVLPDGFTKLGDFTEQDKGWEVANATIKAAKYFIVKMHTTALNGIGGLQFANQIGAGNFDVTSITEDWTQLHGTGTSGIGAENDVMDFFIVIDLSVITKLDVSGTNDIKIFLNYPDAWAGNDCSFVAGYLYSGTLTKPTDNVVDVAKASDTFGWFTAEVSEMKS